jgi:formate C-acetyltransferase
MIQRRYNMHVTKQPFKSGNWSHDINVRDFILKNMTPYEGDAAFLAPATDATKELWVLCTRLTQEEKEKGILGAETKIPSSITSHGPGYLNKNLEKIVGFQTDAPLKRGIMPFGGIRVVKDALESYGYELDPMTLEIFTHYQKNA